MRPTILAAVAASLLSACVAVAPGPTAPVPSPVAQASGDQVPARLAVANFREAVARVEPAAERLCLERSGGVNCDFLVRVDPNPSAPPNAFQSLSPTGRPVLTFTQALIADARNQDEIAFVIGHEAAHHIEGHIPRQRQSASAGALVGGLIATVAGADTATANEISRIGAGVGARSYSREHELEADALGTIITARAGYDPLRGAQFFSRIPDPGDRFLGTHPANAARLEVVRRTAAGL